MKRTALIAAALTTFGIFSLGNTGTAEARRGVRFGGGARVHVRVPGVSVRFARPAYRPRASWSVGGSIRIGGGYRYRPYRPYYYAPVPSYYGHYSASYYPVAPEPNVAAVVVETRPELPKFAFGLFAGGVSVENASESSDIGVVGRYRLTGGLLVEGEIGKMSYENDARVDRRMGASLVWEIGAYNKLAPYVLGGFGVQQADIADRFETTQNYGELGIGLRYAVSPRVHLAFDVRAGTRANVGETEDSGPVIGTDQSRIITPPSDDETEEYTRARLSALIYF